MSENTAQQNTDESGPSTDSSASNQPAGTVRIEQGRAYDVSGKDIGAANESAPAQIDYDALAKKYGAVGSEPTPKIDYLAEAAKMGGTPVPINYIEEARKMGGTPVPIDYDALAKKHGSIGSEPIPQPAQPNLGRFQGVADVGKSLEEFLSGVGGEVFQTAQGAKNLVNKVLPQSAQIPDIPKEYRENITPAEKTGGVVENVGEFLTGEELRKGMGNLVKIESWAKNSPTIAKLLKNSPELVKRVLVSGTKAGIVGGAQGAVKGAAEGNAAAGAEGGAIGGAVGGGAAEVAEPVLGAGVNFVKKVLGLGKTGEELLVKAGRPTVNEDFKFRQALQTAAPRIAEAEPQTLKTVGDFEDFLHDAAQDIRTKEFQPMIDRHADEIISAKPIQDNIRSSVTPQMTKYAPEQAKEIEDFAKSFTDIPLSEAEQDLQFFNAELKKYYKMNAVDQTSTLKTSGTVAKYEAAADGLRDSIYGKLRELGENAPEQLQRQYGALKTLERTFGKRATVADRQAPLNLHQILSLAGGGGHAATALLMGHPVVAAAGAVPIAISTAAKMRNAPESLIRQGVRVLGEEASPKAPSAVGGAVKTGIKKATPAVTAVAGENIANR